MSDGLSAERWSQRFVAYHDVMKDDEPLTSIARHSAGATVQHRGPFAELEVPVSQGPENKQFYRNKWVTPFYMNRRIDSEEFWERYRGVRGDVDLALCRELLAWFDWRPRSVGALFVAIEGYEEATEQIGRLLLRSDVCFAGRTYALALARIGTAQAVEFLVRYLDYYLTRPDLYFDQLDCMGALYSLDIRNNTAIAPPFMKRCEDFYSENPHIHCAQYAESFDAGLSALEKLAPR